MIYFSLYAVMMCVGIRSEIHTCTIEVMKQIFSPYFEPNEIYIMEKAQKARIEAQYYTSQDITDPAQDEFFRFCPRFMVKCKHICEVLTQEEILTLRERLVNRSGGNKRM